MLVEPSKIIVKQVCGLRGVIRVPGDKSISHRVALLGALAEGQTTVRGFLGAEDCQNTLKCLRQMGVQFTQEPEVDIPGSLRIVIQGVGLRGLKEPEDLLYTGNSGTGIRLLTGVLSGQPFFSVISGDEQVRRRPMGRVTIPLREMGAQIWGRQGGNLAPLAIQGGPLRPIEYSSPVASAQVKSALLLAGLFAEGVTQVTEPSLSRDHTERLLASFGAEVQRQGLSVSVKGNPRLVGQHLVIPGDLSSASFFIVGALITPDSDLLIRDVGMNPTRTGLLEVLQEMGGDIQILHLREEKGEPIADLRIRSSRLQGARVSAEQIPRLIDEVPILAVAAACAEGTTVIEGAQELRVKESDRLKTTADLLSRLGVSVEELPDGLKITGTGRKPFQRPFIGAYLQSYGDHRIAMAGAIAGLVAEGETVIEDTHCINTSFPGFQQVLMSVLG